MASIDYITLESPDAPGASTFYREGLGLEDCVRAVTSRDDREGFRGFTMGIDTGDATRVDNLMARAVSAGAQVLKPARRQIWGGYSGVVLSPDAVAIKIATANARRSSPDPDGIERVVLLLGVAHVGNSRNFYAAAALTVAKAFGNKYVEFESSGGAVTLALYKREGLAKEFGVSADGSGSHGLIIRASQTIATDPDGFVWESNPASI